MISKLRKTINLILFILFILITNTKFSLAHKAFDESCNKNCEESFLKRKLKKKSINLHNKNLIKDNYSCLKKSLCSG